MKGTKFRMWLLLSQCHRWGGDYALQSSRLLTLSLPDTDDCVSAQTGYGWCWGTNRTKGIVHTRDAKACTFFWWQHIIWQFKYVLCCTECTTTLQKRKTSVFTQSGDEMLSVISPSINFNLILKPKRWRLTSVTSLLGFNIRSVKTSTLKKGQRTAVFPQLLLQHSHPSAFAAWEEEIPWNSGGENYNNKAASTRTTGMILKHL